MATTTLETFDYNSLPLRHDVAQIRLLSFVKQDPDSRPIRCSLKVFSLADAPTYAALSYVWGDATDRLPLTCNDNGNVAITYNLNRALKYLQHHSDSSLGQDIHWIWADAVCINQKDLDERKAQVLLMRQIYEQAKKTVIWLGEVDSVSRSAMNLIETLHSARLKFNEAKETRMWYSMSEEERVKYGLPSSAPSSRTWFEQLDMFMSSGWFSRLWTIQELAVSPEPVMAAEDFEWTWKDFAAVIEFANKLGTPMWVHGDSSPRWRTLNVTRNRFQRKLPLPLLQLLIITSGLSATDPRDKIYALLGISSGLGSDIQPDYTISVEELYMDFGRRLVRLRRDADHLDGLNVPRLPYDALQPSSGAAAPPLLPSWVPDWRGKVSSTQRPFFHSNFDILPVTQGLSSSTEFIFFRNFAAAPKVSATAGENDVSIEGDLLHLRALRLSHVEAFGLEHGSFNRALGVMDKMRAFGTEAAVLRSEEQLCDIRAWFRRPYPRTGENMRDVYWQTLCAGQLLVSYADTKAGFEKWFTYICAYLRWVPAPDHSWLVALNMFLVNVLTIPAQKQMAEICASDDYRHFSHATTTSSHGRRMFRTEDQCIGMGPPDMEKGDVVFLIKGCRTPMLLRRTEHPDQWTLIGACYLHGFMKGEAYDEERCTDLWLV